MQFVKNSGWRCVWFRFGVGVCVFLPLCNSESVAINELKTLETSARTFSHKIIFHWTTHEKTSVRIPSIASCVSAKHSSTELSTLISPNKCQCDWNGIEKQELKRRQNKKKMNSHAYWLNEHDHKNRTNGLNKCINAFIKFKLTFQITKTSITFFLSIIFYSPHRDLIYSIEMLAFQRERRKKINHEDVNEKKWT